MEPNSIERLHRAGDRQTLQLTHYGRKTGKPYQVTIWYLVGDDKLYLVSANANRNWVRNVKSRHAISLRIGEEVFNGDVREITDPQEREPVALPYLHTWTATHVNRLIAKFQASLQQEPVIPLGAPLGHVPTLRG